MKKLKKWYLGLPLFWQAMLAVACVGIIVAILVLVVGSVICYQFYFVMKNKLPPTVTTNELGYIWYYQHTPAATVTQPATVTAQQISLDGFKLQYGVYSSNGLPWLAAGTNLCATNMVEENCVIYTFENDSNCYDFVQSVGTNLVRVTWTATNDWLTNAPVNVVIQSSTNLTDWSVIYVDPACAPDSVANFTDTNAQSPSNFYRIFYQ